MDVKQSQAEPRLLISRAALLHNAGAVRRAVGANVKMCAVVKADAYGHGAAIVVDTLCNFSTDDSSDSPAVDQVAVASIDEAAALPHVDVPVLIFRPVENAFLGNQRGAIEFAVNNGWTLTIDTPAAATDVNRIAMAINRRASVNLMLDTGMTRGGCDVDRLDEMLNRLRSLHGLRVAGIATHLCSSDDECTREQLRLYRMATDDLAAVWVGKILRHVANSGGIFGWPSAHFDMVRPGLALYGVDPSGGPCMDRPLRPAMRWTAPLIGIRDIQPGGTVGYNQTWRAEQPTRVGLVPVGYADGYPRVFSNRARMLLHGVPCPVIGRVSMDLTTIDVTAVSHVALGDEVTLLSDDPLSPASVYALSQWAETIPYEILARIGARVKRVVVEPAQIPEAK